MEGCLHSDGGGRCRDGERRALPLVVGHVLRRRRPPRSGRYGREINQIFVFIDTRRSHRLLGKVFGCFVSMSLEKRPLRLHPAVSVRSTP